MAKATQQKKHGNTSSTETQTTLQAVLAAELRRDAGGENIFGKPGAQRERSQKQRGLTGRRVADVSSEEEHGGADGPRVVTSGSEGSF